MFYKYAVVGNTTTMSGRHTPRSNDLAYITIGYIASLFTCLIFVKCYDATPSMILNGMIITTVIMIIVSAIISAFEYYRQRHRNDERSVLIY